MKPRLKWVLIFMVSLALTAVTLLFLQKYLSEETQRRLQQAEPESQAVVVFARNAAANEKLTTGHLAVRQFPQQLVSSQWLSANQLGPLLGQRLLYPVQQGEPLTRAMLVAEHQLGLSERIPDDHYVVTLAANEQARHNELLAVGDQVDLVFYHYINGSERSQRSFTKLQVFDLGRTAGGGMMDGISLLVPADRINAFTRHLSDDYSLWVRASDMKVDQQRWEPANPDTEILHWPEGVR